MEECPDPTTRLSPAQRRRLGSYYTPAPVVRFIVGRCLRDGSPVGAGKGPRILDPACGDGVFLAGVFDQIAAGKTFSPRKRLTLVRKHIFGVDVDSPAIMAARATLREKIAANNPRLAEETEAVLAANIRAGNALIGPDFSPASPAVTFPVDVFSWRAAFPDVAAAGGFDIILGNPPYRRELDAKELFHKIADSPLGEKWRQPRMDLWYYFLHRGLDLLKPGGTLSFIVNSYWTASTSARKLIARLQRETNLDEIVLLGNAKIFANVRGRHLIFRLRKQRHHHPCQIVSLEPPRSGKNAARRCMDQLESPSASKSYEIPQQNLYTGGRLMLAKPSPAQRIFDRCVTLGEVFETAQGMAENPPRINRRLNEKFDGQFRIGEGVFVLTNEEISQLEFNDHERALLQPYYETASLGRYEIPPVPTHQVLYLTRKTAPALDPFPNLRRHLEKFRPLLEQRRETRLGRNAWWHLHWPRKKRIFTEPAILSVQMGKVPGFTAAAEPSFVGFSVNVILVPEFQRPREPRHKKTGTGVSSARAAPTMATGRNKAPRAPARTAERQSLKTLAGILNSAIAADWFARHAKHRGVNLDINLGILRQFPLPPRNAELETEMARLVEQRQSHRPQQTTMQQTTMQQTIPQQTIPQLETRIDALVGELYGL